VVIAPFGMTLGGGVEMSLHAAARQPHAELYMGLVEVGVGLLRPATLKRPEDPILHYDLGVHLLLAGKPKDAYESLQRAAQLEAHANTSRLMSYVERVMMGEIPCPRSAHELRQGA